MGTEAGRSNAEIAKMIKDLPESQDHESEKMRLQQQIINIPKTFGFCKTVGSKRAYRRSPSPIPMRSLLPYRILGHCGFWTIYGWMWIIKNASPEFVGLSCRPTNSRQYTDPELIAM